jgi:hypothetical protein
MKMDLEEGGYCLSTKYFVHVNICVGNLTEGNACAFKKMSGMAILVPIICLT